ncbi:ABC transporter permease, partial [Gemella sp. GH3]|uniref:ABC transporter permease n=1 Tax=unclassified Gemella TaxID=2624949 RepID=UPI0015CFBB3F
VIFDKLKNNELIIIFLLYIINIIIYIIPMFNFGFVFVIIYTYYLFSHKKNNNINWYQAAEYDKNRNESYLKFINMFVDVPINVVKISRRKYFDVFLPKLNVNNFNVSNSYNYYYIRSFFRQENTIFLVLRLLALALFVVISLHNIYVSMFVIISYNYLAVLQLMAIYKKMNSILWFYIIPVEDNLKKISFNKLISNILLITTIILVLVSIAINFSLINLLLILFTIFATIFFNKYFLNKL